MRPFRAVLAIEDITTDEGMMHRTFPPGCFSWRALPLPLRAISEDFGGHDGAFVVGRIDAMERVGTSIVGTGVLDDEGQAGDDLTRRLDVIHQIETRQMTGVSVDPGGVVVDESCIATDGDGWCTDVELRFTSYQIGSATVVPIPALEGTIIELVDLGSLPDDAPTVDSIMAEHGGRAPALVASAVQRTTYPARFFDDPELTEITRTAQVDDDGRVYGHLAGWSDCHLSFPDRCVRPWDSPTDFAYFHVCSVETDEGSLPVGPIAATGGHARVGQPARNGDASDWREAEAQYDDPTACVAYARMGRDEFGIWFSGALRPGATEAQVEMLLSHQLSGDWRRIGGSMEVVGACAVNTPGFVRTLALDYEGEPLAAVMASPRPQTLAPAPCGCGGHDTLNVDLEGVVNRVLVGEVASLQRRLSMFEEMFSPQLREHLLGKLNA